MTTTEFLVFIAIIGILVTVVSIRAFLDKRESADSVTRSYTSDEELEMIKNLSDEKLERFIKKAEERVCLLREKSSIKRLIFSNEIPTLEEGIDLAKRILRDRKKAEKKAAKAS